MSTPERVYQRLIHNADRDPATGCLVSRYSTGSHGYAQIGWKAGDGRVVTTAHRALWVYLEGELEPGMTVDHTCKNKQCVERSHLRALTNFDNARRTSGRDWPLGQCVNGHPDSELRQWGKRKRCRLCHNEIQQRRRAQF